MFGFVSYFSIIEGKIWLLMGVLEFLFDFCCIYRGFISNFGREEYKMYAK